MSNFPFLLQAAVSYMSVSYSRGLAVWKSLINKMFLKPVNMLIKDYNGKPLAIVPNVL